MVGFSDKLRPNDAARKHVGMHVDVIRFGIGDNALQRIEHGGVASIYDDVAGSGPDPVVINQSIVSG